MGWMGTWTVFASLCFSFLAAASEPAPIVVEPSEYWEGNDGPWSTFSLRIGSPQQTVRVHASTAWPNTVVVANTSCPQGPDSSCATGRGGTFAQNASTTWQKRGIFALYPELNYSTTQDTAYWGLDSIQLGLEASGAKLNGQVVAAMETTDYYIGYLGIDPQATNWTADYEVQSPSLFKSLRTQGLIPSLAYSYTAGASYRFKKVLGSLVFGGYDASRATPNDLTFSFASDVSRDLVVAIQSIQSTSHDGSTHELLVSGGVLAFVDSTLPYLVLPYDVCIAFEQAFGLVWNLQAGDGGLYTLTETQHSGLVASNPNITFTLGNDLTGGPSIEITLPYAAFDLEAQYPLVNTTTRYFPLLRATNDTQVTLGRTLLQETMLVADYERGNFSLWPCVWNQDAQQSITSIHAVNYTGPSSAAAANTTVTAQQTAFNNLKLELGVGLGAGVALLLIFLAAYLLFARRKRRWPFHKASTISRPRNPELDGTTAPQEVDSRSFGSKRGLVVDVHEAEATVRPELQGSVYHMARRKAELEGSSTYRPSDHPVPYEHPMNHPSSSGQSRPIYHPSNPQSHSGNPFNSQSHNRSPSNPQSQGRNSSNPPPHSRNPSHASQNELSGSDPAGGGSRMLMELVGSPVPAELLGARTPPRSRRGSSHSRAASTSGRSLWDELPPLPASARSEDVARARAMAGEDFSTHLPRAAGSEQRPPRSRGKEGHAGRSARGPDFPARASSSTDAISPTSPSSQGMPTRSPMSPQTPQIPPRPGLTSARSHENLKHGRPSTRSHENLKHAANPRRSQETPKSALRSSNSTEGTKPVLRSKYSTATPKPALHSTQSHEPAQPALPSLRSPTAPHRPQSNPHVLSSMQSQESMASRVSQQLPIQGPRTTARRGADMAFF